MYFKNTPELNPEVRTVPIKDKMELFAEYYNIYSGI